MTVQFSQFHIDKLISQGLDRATIYRAIFCHSHDEEESEELVFCHFVMDADLSTLDENEHYSIEIGSDTNH